MTAGQIIVMIFAIMTVAISIWAIVDIVRSPDLRYKWLWVFGSLFSFFGLTTDIAFPRDMMFWVGANIPAIRIFGLANRSIILSAGVPVIALIVLAKTRYYAQKSPDRTGAAIFD